MSNQPESSGSAILPPKPKPGAPKARKASQPASKDAVAGVSQGQGVTPPQPPSGAPQQAAPQRPAPQQPQAQGPSSRKPSVQAPSDPSSSLPLYKPAPAAIPLPSNSAWAKKLDLQPVVAVKTAPIARPAPPPTQASPAPPATATTPRPEPSQAAPRTAPIAPPTSPPSQPPPTLPAATAASRPEPSQTAAPSPSSAPSTMKAILMADRPASAGAKVKGKGKKKGQGQGPSQQAPVAQPSAPAPSATGQRGSAVKEVPAIGRDSRPRASDSTVLTAPGLLEQTPNASAGLQGQSPPPPPAPPHNPPGSTAPQPRSLFPPPLCANPLLAVSPWCCQLVSCYGHRRLTSSQDDSQPTVTAASLHMQACAHSRSTSAVHLLSKNYILCSLVLWWPNEQLQLQPDKCCEHQHKSLRPLNSCMLVCHHLRLPLPRVSHPIKNKHETYQHLHTHHSGISKAVCGTCIQNKGVYVAAFDGMDPVVHTSMLIGDRLLCRSSSHSTKECEEEGGCHEHHHAGRPEGD